MQDQPPRPPPEAHPEPISDQAHQAQGPYPPPNRFYPPPGQYHMPHHSVFDPYGVASGYLNIPGPPPGFPPPPMASQPGASGSMPHYNYHVPPPPSQLKTHSRSHSLLPDGSEPAIHHLPIDKMDVFGTVRPPTDNQPSNTGSYSSSSSKMEIDSLLDLTPDEIDQFSCDVVPTDLLNSQELNISAPTSSTPARAGPSSVALKYLDQMPRAPASRSQSTIPIGTPKADPAIRRAASQRPPEETDQPFKLPGFIPESPSPDSPDPFSSPSITPTRRTAREGRISNEKKEIIQDSVLQAERILRDAADRTGLTLDIIISQFNDIMGGGIVLQLTPWNYYISYVHTAPYDECKRLGIVYTPGETKPRGEHLASFKEYMGDDWLEFLMLQYSMKVIKKGTIAELEREHAKFVKRVVALITFAQIRWGFQSLFMTCGTSVNEDQSIGTYHVTNHLREFSDTRLKMSADAFIGHAKTHAYNEVSLEHAQKAADDRKAEAEKTAQSGSSSYIPVDDRATNSGSTIEVIALPTRPTSATSDPNKTISRVPSHVPPTPTSRAAHTTGRVKLEGSPAFVPILLSTIGLSDAELRAAASTLGNDQLTKELELLLAKDSDDQFSTGMLVEPARNFIKMWMSVSFALLGLEFQHPSEHNFDWAGFPLKFARAGVHLSGWPTSFPFPGENVPGKEKKGIRVLLADQARKVARAMRFGQIGMERRKEDIEDLLASKIPIYEECAPPATQTLRARRFYLNHTIDYRGFYPINSRAKSSGHSSAVRTSKRRGKSKQVEESDDDEELHAPPPSQYQRSRTTSASPHIHSSNSDNEKTPVITRSRRQKLRVPSPSDDLYLSDVPSTPTKSKEPTAQSASSITLVPPAPTQIGSAVRVAAKSGANPTVKRKAGMAVSSDETSVGNGVVPDKRLRIESVSTHQPPGQASSMAAPTIPLPTMAHGRIEVAPPAAPSTASAVPTKPADQNQQGSHSAASNAGSTMHPLPPPASSTTHANHALQAHLLPAPPMHVTSSLEGGVSGHPPHIPSAPAPGTAPSSIQPGAPGAPDAHWPYPGAPYYQPPQSYYPPQPPYYGHHQQPPFYHNGYPQPPAHPAYGYPQHQFQHGAPPADRNAPSGGSASTIGAQGTNSQQPSNVSTTGGSGA